MHHVQRIMETHPTEAGIEVHDLAFCVEMCYECAQSCTACADACLGEDDVSGLVECIRLDLDCADICMTAGRLLSRRSRPDWKIVADQVHICATICETCADECERHAEHHEHCVICAESCRECAKECVRILLSLPTAST